MRLLLPNLVLMPTQLPSLLLGLKGFFFFFGNIKHEAPKVVLALLQAPLFNLIMFAGYFFFLYIIVLLLLLLFHVWECGQHLVITQFSVLHCIYIYICFFFFFTCWKSSVLHCMDVVGNVNKRQMCSMVLSHGICQSS